MKRLIFFVTVTVIFFSCKNKPDAIIPVSFVDSLEIKYSSSQAGTLNAEQITFWKNKTDSSPAGFVAESRYALLLRSRFLHNGNIQDLKKSDSVLAAIDTRYNHKEPSVLLALAHNAQLQHRFQNADSLYQQAVLLGVKPYDEAAAGFDIAFEMGRYKLAETFLKRIAGATDYGYLFRKAKWEHYKGDPEAAIASMTAAASAAGNDVFLRQAAISNIADLHLHNSDLGKAFESYQASYAISPDDLHSISGMGWIALVHDGNDSLAERIFKFVQSKTQLPDPLFKLEQVMEFRNDSTSQQNYAAQFATMASQPVYGDVYNKYLMMIYTGAFNKPVEALAIAEKEVLNRPTPQTYAWKVWAMHRNGKTAEAYELFRANVSGKPLEGLELYWMGVFMKDMNKGYNANEFFKLAEKNKYDLSPAMMRNLDEYLQE